MTSNEPDNIKAFNYIVLSVLTKLYGEFPNPIEIKGLRFVIETVLDKGSDAVETKYSFLFSPTMMWLKQEGFITFESEINRDKFAGVALTLRGLTVHGFVPRSLFGPQETIFQRAKRVLKKGADEAGSSAVKTVVTEVLRQMAPYVRSATEIAT